MSPWPCLVLGVVLPLLLPSLPLLLPSALASDPGCDYRPRSWSRAYEHAANKWHKQHGTPFPKTVLEFEAVTAKRSVYERSLTPFAPRSGHHPYAVATMTSAGYCARTWALYKSFYRLRNVSNVDFVVMVVGTFEDLLVEVNPLLKDSQYCEALREHGASFVYVKKMPIRASSMPKHYRASLNRLRAFGFDQYKRVLYADSDSLFLSAADGFASNDDFVKAYFEYPPGLFLSAMDQCASKCYNKRRRIVNGGLLSFTPSKKLLNITIARLQRPGCLTPYWKASDQELVICLTIHERLVRGRVWDPPFSAMHNTLVKCPREFPTCAIRHVHFACFGARTQKPPCKSWLTKRCDHESPLSKAFDKIWNDGCTSSPDC